MSVTHLRITDAGSKMYSPVKKLPVNSVGRDFVMGDLHGEVHLLNVHLRRVNFDPSIDRLFSVGDLIDRGTNSLGALRLLHEPWFHAVCGNHEQMMVDFVLRRTGGERWYQNGGDWFENAACSEVVALAKLANRLPKLLIVGDGGSTQFRLVHAEWPFPNELFESISDGAAEACALRSRTLHYQYRNFCNVNGLEQPYAIPLSHGEVQNLETITPCIPIQHGVDLTFCGHTSVQRPGLWRSHFLIDTGCGWWPEASLTLIDTRTAITTYQHFLVTHPGAGDVYEQYF